LRRLWLARQNQQHAGPRNAKTARSRRCRSAAVEGSTASRMRPLCPRPVFTVIATQNKKIKKKSESEHRPPYPFCCPRRTLGTGFFSSTSLLPPSIQVWKRTADRRRAGPFWVHAWPRMSATPAHHLKEPWSARAGSSDAASPRSRRRRRRSTNEVHRTTIVPHSFGGRRRPKQPTFGNSPAPRRESRCDGPGLGGRGLRRGASTGPRLCAFRTRREVSLWPPPLRQSGVPALSPAGRDRKGAKTDACP